MMQDFSGAPKRKRIDRELLAKYWKDGLNSKVIADYLGTTPNTVLSLIRELGLPSRRTQNKTAFLNITVTPEMKDQVGRRARLAGMTQSSYVRKLLEKELQQ